MLVVFAGTAGRGPSVRAAAASAGVNGGTQRIAARAARAGSPPVPAVAAANCGSARAGCRPCRPWRRRCRRRPCRPWSRRCRRRPRSAGGAAGAGRPRRCRRCRSIRRVPLAPAVPVVPAVPFPPPGESPQPTAAVIAAATARPTSFVAAFNGRVLCGVIKVSSARLAYVWRRSRRSAPVSCQPVEQRPCRLGRRGFSRSREPASDKSPARVVGRSDDLSDRPTTCRFARTGYSVGSPGLRGRGTP